MNNKCKGCQWYGKPYWSINNPCDNCPRETVEGKILEFSLCADLSIEELKQDIYKLEQENKQLKERIEYLERSNDRREDEILYLRQELIFDTKINELEKGEENEHRKDS